jgi:hypothetical protein
VGRRTDPRTGVAAAGRLRFPVWVCLAAAVVLLTGCPVKPPPPAPPPPTAIHPSAGKLLLRLAERERAVKNFWAKVETRIKNRREEASADGFLMGLAPDRLRLELIDPVGRPRLIFTSSGRKPGTIGQMGLLVHSEGKFYVGDASPRNLGRVLPLGLGLPEVFTLLAGGTPLIRHTYGRVDWLAGPGQYRLRLGGDPGGMYQVLWFAGPDLNLVRSEVLDKKSQVLFRAVFSDFRPVGQQRFPMHLVMSVPSGKVLVEFKYVWLKVNVTMNERPFLVQPPEGVKVIKLIDKSQKTSR